MHQHQPAKFAAIEARWHDEQPASEVIIAIPDEATESNRYELKIPVLGSIIGSMSTTSKEVGLTSFPPQDRPPVLIPFMTFRVMVGCGLIMLGLAWLGSWLIIKHRIEKSRWLLRFIFLSFPLPFIATLAGWYTAEVGRQPWVVYGVLRTAKAMTPFLTAQAAATTLILFAAVYAFIFSFGIYYIYRLLRAGPGVRWPRSRPTPCPTGRCRWPTRSPSHIVISFRQENRHGHVLGRIAGDQHPDLSSARRLRSRRRHPVPAAEQRVAAASHAGCDRAVLGRQRDLACGDRRDPVGCLSGGVRHGAFGFLYSCHLHAAGLDPARGRLRIPQQVAAVALDLESEL